jgi:hypothetical protein
MIAPLSLSPTFLNILMNIYGDSIGKANSIVECKRLRLMISNICHLLVDVMYNKRSTSFI